MKREIAGRGGKLSFDAVVVGAGLAGCAAAISMASQGLQVAILERGQKPGGKNYFGERFTLMRLQSCSQIIWIGNHRLNVL